MPKGIANHCYLHAALKRMRGMGVPEEVRAHVFLDPGVPRGGMNDPPRLGGIEPPAPPGEDVAFTRCFTTEGAYDASGGSGGANGPGLTPFAVDGDEERAVGGGGEIGPPQPDQLGDAEASGIGQSDEGVVAAFGEGEHVGDVSFGENAVGEPVASLGL